MQNDRGRAAADFKRMMLWIAGIAVLMVIGALGYISLYEPLRLHMVVATVLGVFFSVLLGSGLFAAAFYSDKAATTGVSPTRRAATGRTARAQGQGRTWPRSPRRVSISASRRGWWTGSAMARSASSSLMARSHIVAKRSRRAASSASARDFAIGPPSDPER